MEKSIFERLLAGQTVKFSDSEYHKITESCTNTRRLCKLLNDASDDNEIRKVLSEITEKEIDKSVTIFPPFYINYGKNLKLGKFVFINFGCTILDLGGVEIGNKVMIAPGVKLLSEGHPVNPSERQQLTANKIIIKDNVWIGAGATVLQGVTIGENSVVAAGAVVSKNVPANTLVGGIPAKVLKEI